MVPEVRADFVLGFRVVHGDQRATTTGAKAAGLGARALGAQLQYVGCQVGVGIRGQAITSSRNSARALSRETCLMDVVLTTLGCY